jgi:sortase A
MTVPPEAPTVVLPPGAQPVPKEGAEQYVQLGTMQIPAIKIDMPLGEGVTLTNLNRGPGHWPGTALPGEIGNVVIGGHRVSHSHPFRDLDKLASGDTVTVTVTAGTFTYSVAGTEIVLPTDIQVLDQTAAHTATLFACHPKGQTTQRIIVHLLLTGSSV